MTYLLRAAVGGTLLLLLLAAGCRSPERRVVFAQGFQENGATLQALEANTPPPKYDAPDASVEVLPPAGAAPLALSLEEAVVYALRGNRDLAVQQFEPVIAGTFEQIERGEFDPEVFANLELMEEVSNETSRSTGGQFSVEAHEATAELGLRQTLPAGTTLEATVEQERTISDRAPELQTARLGFRVTQALLRGRRTSVNLASIRQAELDTEISEHELRGYTEAIVAATETAYWNYVLAQEEIAIFESSLDVARRQCDDIEQRIEVGTLPKNEAAASRAEVARREQALIDARSQLEERRLNLLRLIGPGDNPYAYQLRATSLPRLDCPPITNLDERLELAVQSRPELGEARLRLEQNRLETIVTRDGLRPRLDFFIEFGRSGYEDTVVGSFEKILDTETYDISVGFELSHVLSNRAARAEDRAAWVGRRQAEKAIANLEDAVCLDVRLALNEIERARQQIEATAVTRNLQEESLRAEQERLDVGAGTTLLVAQAQRDLLESRIAEVRAIVTCRTALVRLYLAEGSLLARRGIRLET